MMSGGAGLEAVGRLHELADVAGALTIIIPASLVLAAVAAWLGYLRSKR